jgi:hypothetical protein
MRQGGLGEVTADIILGAPVPLEAHFKTAPFDRSGVCAT